MRKQRQFCTRGHDTFITGKDKWGHCILCCRIRSSLKQKTLKYKEFRKQFNRSEKRRKYMKIKNREYQINNFTEIKEYQQEYKKLHPEISKISSAKNKTNRRCRFVSWGQEDIKEFYRNCPINMVVDHIVPLQNKLVSGLHVRWNLQYLTSFENGVKNNKFDGTLVNSSWRNSL